MYDHLQTITNDENKSYKVSAHKGIAF